MISDRFCAGNSGLASVLRFSGALGLVSALGLVLMWPAMPVLASEPVWLADGHAAQSAEEPMDEHDEQDHEHEQGDEDLRGDLPLDELRTFVDVFDRIKSAYVEEVDDATLLDSAIRGMLSELDPHSLYLQPEDFESLQITTAGEFGGLGIEVGMEDGFIKVVTPIDDTPAQRAGIEAGDLIVKLDDKSTKGLSLSDAVDLMRGKPGTMITLTVIRDGEAAPIEVDLMRAVIQVASVKSRLLEPHFGYVRITQFQVNTGKEVEKAVNKLNDESVLKGLVLDMRNNPGGVLQAAVDVSSLFMDEGLVVYTKGRNLNSDMRFNAEPGDMLNELPIVVLVNSGSASASEIVAGALQDHRRAVIMGTPTFGKGSVQTVLPLSNDHAIKLTTARYYTPSDRSIQAEGIVPDISVKQSRVTALKNQEEFRESNLRGHLENEAEQADADKGEAKTEIAEKDYQLSEALNLLKGLNILGRATR